MTPREFDESDARIRPARRTRPRSKDRPSHSDAIQALVTTVDRGRTTCVTDDGVAITAMKARELGPKSVVVGDLVEIVGDVSGTEGTLARIVTVNERTNCETSHGPGRRPAMEQGTGEPLQQPGLD